MLWKMVSSLAPASPLFYGDNGTSEAVVLGWYFVSKLTLIYQALLYVHIVQTHLNLMIQFRQGALYR